MDIRRRIMQCSSQNINDDTEESIKAGDVVYYANNKLNVCKLDNWSTSLGTAIGVVVIPPNILPDGKCRIISLKFVNYQGSAVSNNTTTTYWYNSTSDTSLNNYTSCPLLSTNDGNIDDYTTAYGGYLPSDNFDGETCYMDNETKYNVSVSGGVVPSPYYNNATELNPLYTLTISGGNILSDFNGYNNTTTLYNLGTRYRAARGCYLYNDGSSSTKWHLPSVGETCFFMVRSKIISDSITALGGISPYVDQIIWTSTEYDRTNAYIYNPVQGYISYQRKSGATLIRPFATIDLQ